MSRIVDGSTGDEARLKVNFYGEDQDNPIESLWVKAKDLSDEEKFNKIVYDPGAGDLGDNLIFHGWTTEKQYNKDTDPKTIDGIRDIVKEKLQATGEDAVTEGDELNVYAVLFKVYSISYIDEKGISQGTETVQITANDEKGETSYTVNMSYTPDDTEHSFMGWHVANGKGNIVDYEEGHLYENGDTITIKGDVTFSVYEPLGHWLVFDENGKGATYNAPQFVVGDSTTQKPRPDSEMLRYGYTFAGWYTDKECTDGNEFTFGEELKENTTIYAKWTSGETANYTVIIWKQNVTGDGYDYAESITLSGAVGSTVDSITETGTGDGKYARIDGIAKQYTGFHLDRYDTDKVIVTEGSTVVNVVYNRNEITINFYTWQTGSSGYIYTPVSEGRNETQGRYYTSTTATSTTQVYYNPSDGKWYTNRTIEYDGWWDWFGHYVYSGESYDTVYNRNQASTSGSWVMYKTFTGLYGASLSGSGYEWPTDYNWYDGHNNRGGISGTRTTFMDAFLPPDGGSTLNFYGSATSGDRTIHFQQQDADDPTKFTDANTVKASGGTFYITDKYNGFQASQYRVGNYGGWNNVGQKGADGVYGSGVRYNDDLYIRFIRLKYNLLYMDGVYVDGNGNTLTDYASRGELGHKNDITYGSNMSTYNKGGRDYFEPEFNGFAFEGWFIDEKCTTPYTFKEMPLGGLTVYAKWRQVEYRVFLHPNAGTEDSDPSLSWGKDEHGEEVKQAMTFRVADGGTISVPTGLRDDYEFVGWFADPEFTQIFNPATKLVDSNTVAYDKNTDFTDPMDRWGNGATWNSDVIGYKPTPESEGQDRFWITKKFELYAKWRATLVGADGINVIYDENVAEGGKEGSAPSDATLYVDSSEAVADAASKAETAEAGQKQKVFSHWVVQTWDNDANDYVDKIVDGEPLTVLPGEIFMVYKADARVVPKEGSTEENPLNTYTVRLQAKYVDLDEATPTHIYWYSNFGTPMDVVKTNTSEGKTIGENDLKINQAVDIKPENTFTRTGFKFKGWSKVEAPAEGTEPQIVKDLEVNFLWYSNGKFYKDEDLTQEVKEIAADERSPYENLYAVWEREYVDLTIQKKIDGEGLEYLNIDDGFIITVALEDSEEGLDDTQVSQEVKDATGTAASKTVNVTLKPTISKPSAEVTLTIPKGAKYEVSEGAYAGFVTTYKNEKSDSIQADTTATVTNTAKKIPITGLDLDTTAAKTALLSLFAFVMMCGLGFSLKRRYASSR